MAKDEIDLISSSDLDSSDSEEEEDQEGRFDRY